MSPLNGLVSSKLSNLPRPEVFLIIQTLIGSQTSNLLAGTESPQEEEESPKEEEEGSGSGEVDYTDADQANFGEVNEAEVNEARSFWNELPADTRRELAHQELANKQFQMYLKALILEAKNMYQKNYLEFM